jgi:hypothetical protein
MTNSEKFKKQFPDFKGIIDYYTDDREELNFIDVQADEVDFITIVPLSCGCCFDYESRTETLSHVMDKMRDQDFKMLCGEMARFDRLEGLINQNHLKQFIEAIELIGDDLVEKEGFDPEDVRDYLNSYLKDILGDSE